MDPADTGAFAPRDRTEVERLELEHWARVYRERGGGATVAAGHALYEHARRARPDHPTEPEVADDLAHHIELKRLLDRVSGALALR